HHYRAGGRASHEGGAPVITERMRENLGTTRRGAAGEQDDLPRIARGEKLPRFLAALRSAAPDEGAERNRMREKFPKGEFERVEHPPAVVAEIEDDRRRRAVQLQLLAQPMQRLAIEAVETQIDRAVGQFAHL